MPKKFTEEQIKKREQLIKYYVGRNYSANRIQKELQKKGLGMRRKDLLKRVREIREAKTLRAIPRIPKKRYKARPWFMGRKAIAVYGTVNGKSRRIEMVGSGRQLYNAMLRVAQHPPKYRFVRCRAYEAHKYLDYREKWDEHPQVIS